MLIVGLHSINFETTVPMQCMEIVALLAAMPAFRCFGAKKVDKTSNIVCATATEDRLLPSPIQASPNQAIQCLLLSLDPDLALAVDADVNESICFVLANCLA